jgi:hypothetical protein
MDEKLPNLKLKPPDRQPTKCVTKVAVSLHVNIRTAKLISPPSYFAYLIDLGLKKVWKIEKPPPPPALLDLLRSTIRYYYTYLSVLKIWLVD